MRHAPFRSLIDLTAVCIAACLAPAAADAALIGVDARHVFLPTTDLYSGPNRSQFRATITGLGHTLVPLHSFAPTDLAGLRAVILMQPLAQTRAEDYSTEEMDAIHAFVASGGGLVVHAEGGYYSDLSVSNYNALAAPYGVSFDTQPTDGDGINITGFVQHPVTEGLSTVGVDYQRRLVSIAPPAADLTTGPGASDFLAAVTGTGGAGNVVLLSDSSLFTDAGTGSDRPITFGDNQRLAENIIRFVTVPEPATAALLLLSCTALLSRRRRV